MTSLFLQINVIEPLQKLERQAAKAGNKGVETIARRAIATIDDLHHHVHELEIKMGKTADAINELEAKLTTASANALDDADNAAIAGVPAFLAGLSNGSNGALSNGSQGQPTQS